MARHRPPPDGIGPMTAREAPPARTTQAAMGVAFAAGSACFVIGPFPGYLDLVGRVADAVTFFGGSVLFTIGGGLQTWLAAPSRREPGAGRAAWWAAVIQSLGTL